jgi:hypothetical protein
VVPACVFRTHRRARDWQRYVVGKVLQSPWIPEDPDAGAGLVTATAVGARAGEPAARSTIERGGRLKHSGTHPLASVAQGQRELCLEHGQCHLCTLLCTQIQLSRGSIWMSSGARPRYRRVGRIAASPAPTLEPQQKEQRPDCAATRRTVPSDSR